MDIPLGKVPPSPAGASTVHKATPREAAGPDLHAAPQVPKPERSERPVQMQPSRETVKKVAQQINDFLKATSANLEFSVDGDSHKVVVRIVDAQTKELIRQIPSEDMIAMSKAIDTMSGLLIRQKV